MTQKEKLEQFIENVIPKIWLRRKASNFLS